MMNESEIPGKTAEKKPEGAERIVNEVYKGVGADRVVDKLKIAWNQSGVDRHSRAAVRFKSQMDGFDSRIADLNQGRKELESNIEELKQIGVDPSSLQLEIDKIEKQKTRLKNDKNTTQSKFEKRENKIRLCTNERDRIANEFIGRYEEKLRPIEAKLEGLQASRDEVDLLIMGAEIKFKEKLAEVDELEKQRNKLANDLRISKMSSERMIRKDKTIKQLEKKIRDGYKGVRVEKESLTVKRGEIDREIARFDAKANPYRDKRERFVRVKEGRPIEFNMSDRKRIEFTDDKENVKTHIRNEFEPKKSSDSIEIEKNINQEKVKNKERLATTYINDWNEFVKEKYGDKAEVLINDEKDFLKKFGLVKNNKMDFADFKKILGRYLKHEGILMGKFNESIDEFKEKVSGGKKA